MENYIVSARKYRPSTFESVVGQRALTETLRNAIRSGHLAHAYLFCGPRGVGKTTCARIFAKTINCLNPTDSHDACNECESCRAFNEQRSFNIHELDAASNNSVEDIRQLIQEVRIPPQIGKYSVYIIDEVHMLSSGAFNALLKTLEEPPSYAIFILATTEKHKVLPTILSRCQVYDFSRITVADTIAHLAYVAKQEGITVGEDSLNVIAQKADGGMRDALSIFDQLVSFAGNDISYERTIEVLNVLDTDYYFRLVDLTLGGDVPGALLMLNEVLQKGFDAQHFVSGFAQHLRDVLVSKDPQTIVLLETSEAIRQHYAEQAQRCAATWLFKALDIMNTVDIQYRTAKNKRLTVELGLIRLCQLTMPQEAAPAVAPVAPVAPAAKPTASAAPTASRPVAAPAAATAQPAAPTSAPVGNRPTAMPSIPRVPGLGSMPQIPTLGRKPETPAAPANSSPTSDSAPAQNSPFTDDQLQRAWSGLIPIFRDEARLVALVSEHLPEKVSETVCRVTLSNQWQKEALAEHKSRILSELRKALHNDSVGLEAVIAEYEHVKQAYTQEEKYKVLVDMNEEVAHLKEVLSLQLE